MKYNKAGSYSKTYKPWLLECSMLYQAVIVGTANQQALMKLIKPQKAVMTSFKHEPSRSVIQWMESLFLSTNHYQLHQDEPMTDQAPCRWKRCMSAGSQLLPHVRRHLQGHHRWIAICRQPSLLGCSSTKNCGDKISRWSATFGR